MPSPASSKRLLAALPQEDFERIFPELRTIPLGALHRVEERCCRRLLETHDYMRQQDFILSHQFLAVMLGVRRQTVTVIAGTLQTAELIRYKHGHIRVLDRKGLESASCECYAVIRGYFDRLSD